MKAFSVELDSKIVKEIVSQKKREGRILARTARKAEYVLRELPWLLLSKKAEYTSSLGTHKTIYQRIINPLAIIGLGKREYYRWLAFVKIDV